MSDRTSRATSTTGTTDEAPLGLRGRINFEYILGAQMVTYQSVLKNEEFKEEQVREVIKGFVDILPEAWRDDKFKKDLDKAVKKEFVDIRPLVAGNIRLSKEVCEKLNIPFQKEKAIFDYRAIMHACINLLNRRRLLSKVNPVEELDHIELEKIGEAEAAKTGKSSLQSE